MVKFNEIKRKEWVLIGIVVVLALVVFGEMNKAKDTEAAVKAIPVDYGYDSRPPEGDTVDIYHYYIFTAPNLNATYQANEVAADAKYKDKNIEVIGYITSISKDFTDNIIVELSDGEDMSFNDVRCYFPNEAEAAKLYKGESVAFIGTCKGMILKSVMVDDCILDAKATRDENEIRQKQ